MGDVPSFGTWLKRRRKALDLTQDALAQLVGCAVVTIRKLEAEVQPPSRQLAERLAEHLAIPAEQRATFIQFARLGLNAPPPELPLPPQARVPELAPASPLPPSLSRERTNLPAQLTQLVGRQREVAQVCALLRRPDVRLLTLTGPGGIGKTRLALQVATEAGDTFADGLAFVLLAPIHDPSLVIPTVAQTLAVAERVGRPILDCLKDYLRNRHMLLVLDNFEQVIEAAPQISEIMAAAARLSVLVTSRAALQLSGEHRFVVPPLALPELNRLPTTPDLAATMAQSAAVELFVQRACAVLPSFALTDVSARAVAEICHRLDGLPLAIELAAARVTLYIPQELLVRLEQRFPLLTGGPRDRPAHQQTLRATLDWSYHLLTVAEQTLLRQLGVFVGGCTLEMAQHVCDATGDMGRDVAEGVAALLHQSLVQREEGLGGEPRFVMLETIREYALERLVASEEAEILRRRHALHYLALAESAASQLAGSEQRVWLARLEAEHGNLRAALAWSQTAAGDAMVGLRLAGVMWRFWSIRGYLSEGRTWLTKLLALASGRAASPSIQAQALYAAGVLARHQGDCTQTAALCGESLALFRDLEDRRGMAWSLNELGWAVQAQGDCERAAALYQEGLALFRDLDDRRGIAEALDHLGRVARAQGDYRLATTRFQESVRLFRTLEDTRGIAIALKSLGSVRWLQGDYAAAHALHEESLRLFRELGDSWGIALALDHLGLVAREQGDYAMARTLFEESLALAQQVGYKEGVAFIMRDLGTLARQQGDHERAHRLLEESLRLFRELGNRDSIALVLTNLGLVALAQDECKRAASRFMEGLIQFRDLGNTVGSAFCLKGLACVLAQHPAGTQQSVQLFGAATALLAASGAAVAYIDQPTDRYLADMRSRLAAVTFAAAWAAGQAMTLERAIALALEATNVSLEERAI